VPEIEQPRQYSFINPFGFTGYQTDDIPGLLYAQARSYNPATGSFTAEDPICDQHNWYGYGNANPIGNIDPTGLASTPHSLDNSNQCEGGINSQAVCVDSWLLTAVMGLGLFSDPEMIHDIEASGSRYRVMLRYIIEKNGGTVTWCDDLRAALVNMPGFREFVIYGELRHERLVVDPVVLSTLFGLSHEQATHQAWDAFSSMDSAAIAFALMHTDHADYIYKEIGAAIYAVRTGPLRNPRIHYTFGTPWIGQEYNVVAGVVGRAIGGIFVRGGGWEPGRPDRADWVALAHTHPAGNNWFSSQDRRLAHGVYNVPIAWPIDLVPGLESPRVGVPAMPVFMSVSLTLEQAALRGHSMQVRRYDDSMCLDDAWGEMIFSK